MSEQFLEYFPNDFIHLLLSAYSADETGHVGGQCPQKQNQNVTFSAETGIYKLMKSQYNVDLNEHLTNWFVYDVIDDAQTGYLGLIFENKQNRQLVLSHRSTNFKLSFLQNFFKQSGVECDTMSVVIGGITCYQAQAYAATKKAVQFAKDLNYSLSFCGHSLGAWLAELSIYYYHCEFDPPYANVKAVTFDGPGSWEMMEFMDKSHIKGQSQMIYPKQFDIVYYLSAPNIVNCMNSHIGIGYRLYPDDDPLNHIVKIQKIFDKLFPRKNIVTGVAATFGHDLKYIVPCFDPTTGKPYLNNYLKIVKWPKIIYKGSGNKQQIVGSLFKNVIDKFLPEVFRNGLGKGIALLIKSNIVYQLTFTTLCSVAVMIKELKDGNIKQEQFWKVHQCLNKTKFYQPDQELNDVDIFSESIDAGYKIVNPNDFQRELQKDESNDFIDKHLITLYQNSKRLFSSSCNNKVLEQIYRLVQTYEIRKKTFQNVIQIKDEFRNQMLTINTIRDQIRILIRDFEEDFEDYLNEHPYFDENKIDCFFGRIFNYDNNFVNRNQLNDIETAFTKSNVVVITGPPKFGKTTLAYQYAKKLKDSVHARVWSFNAQNQSSMHQDLCFYHNHLYQLATQTQIFESLVAEVWAKLQNVPFKFIIIFDNVENFQFIQPFINQTPQNIRIVITAINYSIFSNTKYEIIKISAMSELECLNYINNVVINRQLDQDQKNQIVKLSNGMPQLLNLYISQFINSENSLDTTQQIYQSLDQCQENSLYELFIENLKDELCKKLLKYISWLYPQKIEFNLILQLTKNQKIDKDDVIKSLQILANQGLISILPKQCIMIDNSIQEECRREEQTLYYLQESLQYFFITLPDIDTIKHSDASLNIAQSNHLHARNIINLLRQKNLFEQFFNGYPDLFHYATTITLKLSVIYQYLIIDYQSCQEYMEFLSQQYYEAMKHQKSIDYQSLSILCINKTKLLLAMGKKEEAIQNNTLKNIIELEALQECPSLKASIHNELAVLYQQIQQYDLSNQEIQKANQIYSQIYAQDDIRKLKLLYCLAENFQLQKQYTNAGVIYTSVIKLIEEKEAQQTLRDIFTLQAKIYYQLGRISFQTNQDPSVIKNYFCKAIQIWKEKLKTSESIEIADFTLNLGLSFKQLKQYPESLEALTNAHEIKSKVLGTDFNDQIAKIYFEKGLLFIEINEIEKAEKEFLYAQNMIAGSNNFELKSKIDYQIALIYKSKDQKYEYIKALEELIKKQRKHYTFIHPSLTNTLKSLADAYSEYFQDNVKQTDIYQQIYFISLLHQNEVQFYQQKNPLTEVLERKTFKADHNYNYLQWLKDENSLKVIQRYNQHFFDQDFSRTLILRSGILSKEEFSIKEKLQISTLNNLIKYSYKGRWTGGKIGFLLYGVKDFISINHLKSELAEEFKEIQNQKLALMLCFEAINIGIVQSNFQHLGLAQNFIEQVITYPNMRYFLDDTIKIHPEYFIDGKILKSLTIEKNYLKQNLGIQELFIQSNQQISKEIFKQIQNNNQEQISASNEIFQLIQK